MNYILFTVAAGVARLTLNRPDKLNSFTGAMHAELRDALDSIQTDKSIRVLVITGAGRAFCAGQDLADPDMVMGATAPDIGNVVEQNYKPQSRNGGYSSLRTYLFIRQQKAAHSPFYLLGLRDPCK